MTTSAAPGMHAAKEVQEVVTDPQTYERENAGYTEPVIPAESMASPQEFSWETEVAGTNLLLALLLFVVIGASSVLFNNLIGSYSDGIRRFSRHLPFLAYFEGKIAEETRLHRGMMLAIFLFLYALIAAHVNPSFSLLHLENRGIMLVSLATVVTGTYAKDSMRYLIAKRWKAKTLWKPHIVGVILATICVAFSRFLQVSPGYLFGIPIVLFIFSRKYEEREGLLESLALLWVFGLALGAWFLAPMMLRYDLLHDFLNLLYVLLIEVLFFELLPIAGLPGAAILRWRKGAWALLSAGNIFMLLQTLWSPQSTLGSIEKLTSSRTAVSLLVGYAALSLAAWGLLAWKQKRALAMARA